MYTRKQISTYPVNTSTEANCDEVTYADNTIYISTGTKAMNNFIEAIEWEGLWYGLKLNRGRCELITTHNKCRCTS